MAIDKKHRIKKGGHLLFVLLKPNFGETVNKTLLLPAIIMEADVTIEINKIIN